MSVIAEPAAPSRPRASDSAGLPEWWPTAAFVVAAIACAAIYMYEGRGLTFFFDEWSFIIDRRDTSLDSLLTAHVGHLSLLPVAIYQLFFQLFGLTHYAPFRLLVLLIHLGCATLVFAYLRRRLSPAIALVPAVVLLFYGSAWQDLIWPFQIGFMLSVTAGVGAFLLLDKLSPRAAWGVFVLVCVAIASSSISLPIAGAICLELLLSKRWRQLWVVVVPVLGYLLWYAFYSDTYSSVQNVEAFVRYWVEAAGAVIGSMLGVGSDAGQVLLLAVVPLVAWRIVVAEPERRPRLIALAAIPTVYWGLLAVSRAGFQPAGASRYLYPAAAFILLLLAELLRGVRIVPIVAVLLVLVASWSVVWNINELHDGRVEVLLPFTRQGRVQYGAMEVGVRSIESDWKQVRPPVPKKVADYVDAFRDLGSPGLTVAEIKEQPEDLRRIADAYLIRAAGLDLLPPSEPAGDAPDTVRGTGGVPDGASCVRFEGAVDIEVQPNTSALLIDAFGASGVVVRLRSFGDEYSTFDEPLETVPPGEARDLPLPRVESGPWRVGLSSNTGVRVCGADLPSP